MPDPDAQPGPQRVVCAVCTTAYDDDPGAHRIRRCPSCGSRLIRQEDGRLGAVATAAPPPKKAPGGAASRESDAQTTALVAAGVVMLVVALGLGAASVGWLMRALGGLGGFWMMGGSTAGTLIGTLVFAVAGVYCLQRAATRSMPAKAGPGRACFACGYPLPWNHAGRCPECGKLQSPLDPKNGKCPACRRSLTGFNGDACPECGADVRMVIDGLPADESRPD